MNQNVWEFGERRLHDRKTCSRMIGIDDGGYHYSGIMRDLAKGGAFIELQENHETRIGRKLHVIIPFGLQEGHLTLRVKVARIRPEGIGVRFITPANNQSLL